MTEETQPTETSGHELAKEVHEIALNLCDYLVKEFEGKANPAAVMLATALSCRIFMDADDRSVSMGELSKEQADTAREACVTIVSARSAKDIIGVKDGEK